MNTESSPPSTATNRHDFTEKLSELRGLLADIANKTPAAASDSFDELKAKASALCESWEGGFNKVTHTVAKTVKDHPAQVAIAAIGAGLIAWWLLSRGKGEHKSEHKIE